MIDPHEIVVGMADLKVGQFPSTISTSLGSCIGVCLYSSQNKAGGMLHLMMDYAGGSANKEGFKKSKYADTGIPELLHQLKINYRINPNDCIAKIFGGGRILQNVTHNIGEANEIAVKKILASLGIRIVASKTGGVKGYKIKMHLDTGKVFCQILGGPVEEF